MFRNYIRLNNHLFPIYILLYKFHKLFNYHKLNNFKFDILNIFNSANLKRMFIFNLIFHNLNLESNFSNLFVKYTYNLTNTLNFIILHLNHMININCQHFPYKFYKIYCIFNIPLNLFINNNLLYILIGIKYFILINL